MTLYINGYRGKSLHLHGNELGTIIATKYIVRAAELYIQVSDPPGPSAPVATTTLLSSTLPSRFLLRLSCQFVGSMSAELSLAVGLF